MDSGSESGNKLPVLQTATALAVSFSICKAGEYITKFFAIPGGILPAVTAIVVILATAFPTQFNHLAPSGEALALILMQVSWVLDNSVYLVGLHQPWRSWIARSLAVKTQLHSSSVNCFPSSFILPFPHFISLTVKIIFFLYLIKNNTPSISFLINRYFLLWLVQVETYGMWSILRPAFSCLLWSRLPFILLWSLDLESYFASTKSCC